jgi:hypothetical protein
MNMKPLRPTSTTGLKRLAHGLKKHRDLTQSEAMEHAAVLAGYRNLREAQLAFGETPAPSVLPRDKQAENPASIRMRTRGWGLVGRA